MYSGSTRRNRSGSAVRMTSLVLRFYAIAAMQYASVEMTALEEIKESTRDSLATKQRALSDLIDEHREDDTEIRDATLDIISDALTMYKVTVAQARAAENVDEVAELWRDAHMMYASTLTLWLTRRGAWSRASG